MRILVIAVAIAFTIACSGGQPTATTSAPSSTAPPTRTPPPASSAGFLSLQCGEELDGYQCRADYGTSPAAGPTDDVTGFTTWSSSDTTIATVNSVGYVTVHQAGSLAIRASYRGLDAFITMTVEVGGLRRYYKALSGFVTDAQDATKLSGVTVQILDGANANRTVATGSDGAYQMYNLTPGTFTVRFSKAGYMTLNRVYTLPGDRFNDLSVALQKQ